jgi:hypothetical protein
MLVALQPNQVHGHISFPLGGEKKRDPSPRYYIHCVVRSHQAAVGRPVYRSLRSGGRDPSPVYQLQQ